MKVELLEMKPTKKNDACFRFSLRLLSDSGEVLVEARGLRFYTEMQEITNTQLVLGYNKRMDITVIGGAGRPALRDALNRLLDEAGGDFDKLANLRTIVWSS